MKFYFSILIICISLSTLASCSEKQTRVNACIRITKARIAQDQVIKIEMKINFIYILGSFFKFGKYAEPRRTRK
jgi:hypothetical protein